MSIGTDFQAVWDEIKTWAVKEWRAFSTAELALLKSELPTITAAGAKALEDFVIQEASSLGAVVGMSGPQKASTLAQTIGNALNVGLQVINGTPVKADQPLSTTLMNALVEAGATAAKVGIAALMAGA